MLSVAIRLQNLQLDQELCVLHFLNEDCLAGYPLPAADILQESQAERHQRRLLGRQSRAGARRGAQPLRDLPHHPCLPHQSPRPCSTSPLLHSLALPHVMSGCVDPTDHHDCIVCSCCEIGT